MAHPASWSPKDPDETVNYELPWDTQLDEGDTVATSAWLDVTGVTLEGDSIGSDSLRTYARVSGGVHGTTATLVNRVTTAEGEILEQFVSLPIVSTAIAALGDYEVPTPQHLVAKYPRFHDVPYDTINLWIQDAATNGVDTSWLVGDYAPAIMALAAHNMTLLGLGEQSQAEQHARQGVSSLKDGNFSVSFNDKCVEGVTADGYGSTLYGRDYRLRLRRNRAGPRLVGSPIVDAGWGPLAQQNNGVILP